MAENRVASRYFEKKPDKPQKDYRLISDIRSEKIYKANVINRDKYSRLYLESLAIKNTNCIIPGQLIMFEYFEPKTKEELKYYDAMPCTIFFGLFNTPEGKRVLGFNLHYYPPRIRYYILDRIFEIFKPIFLKDWSKPSTRKNEDIRYDMLMRQLKEKKLDFGVRMYIPKLMDKIRPIPVKEWSRAVFTEGRFKKVSREAIINYWKQQKVSKIY